MAKSLYFLTTQAVSRLWNEAPSYVNEMGHYLPPAPWPWKRIPPKLHVHHVLCWSLQGAFPYLRQIFQQDSQQHNLIQAHNMTMLAKGYVFTGEKKKNNDLKNEYVLLFFFKEKLIFFNLNSSCFLVFCYNILLNL